MNAETAPEGGSENSAGGRVHSNCNADQTAPLESGLHCSEPWRTEYERHLTAWSQGFNAAWDFLSPMLDRANSDADYWYARATNPEVFEARHREALATFAVLQNRKSTADQWAELDRIAAERVAGERREVAE